MTKSGRDGIQVLDANDAILIGNHSQKNGRDGLHVEGDSANLVILLNKLRKNDGFDAFDSTTGSGTGGTANHWFLNSIGTKNVKGLK